MLRLFCGILSIYQIKVTRDIFEWKIFALKDFGIIIIFGHHMSIKVTSTCVCSPRDGKRIELIGWKVDVFSNVSDQFNIYKGTNVPIHMTQVLFFRISLEIYSSKTSPSEHFMRRGKTTDGRAPFSDDDVGYIYKKMRAQLRLILLRTTQRPQKTTYTQGIHLWLQHFFQVSKFVHTYILVT